MLRDGLVGSSKTIAIIATIATREATVKEGRNRGNAMHYMPFGKHRGWLIEDIPFDETPLPYADAALARKTDRTR
jgi:hypothetical protein